jgi:predicted PurR-regulated permease PerM
MLLLGTGNVFIAVGQLLSASFLTFFLLASGDALRRRFIGAVGPSLARRRKAVLILEDVHNFNQHYFAVVLAINLAIGVVTALGFYAIGMERPAVWGIATAILHTIPYVGAVVIAVAAALVAYGQFGAVQTALLVGCLPIAVSAVLGIGVQTWLMGRAARMSAPAVFIALMFWGMVWGGWGLLLAVPIMVAVKTVFDHVDALKPVGAMLGP